MQPKNEIAASYPVSWSDLVTLPLGLLFRLSFPADHQGLSVWGRGQHVIKEDHTPVGSLKRISTRQRPTPGMACRGKLLGRYKPVATLPALKNTYVHLPGGRTSSFEDQGGPNYPQTLSKPLWRQRTTPRAAGKAGLPVPPGPSATPSKQRASNLLPSLAANVWGWNQGPQ